MSEPSNILWILTQPVDFRQAQAWDRIEVLGRKLIAKIGSPDFNHEVISPRELFPKLVEQLEGERFSTIVNIASAEFGVLIRHYFPKTPVVHFPISRVRDAERIETLGYQIHLPIDKLIAMKSRYDLSRPLLFDDVGHTGGTQYMTMQILDIEPKTATHAFLVANVGIIAGQPAIVPYLEAAGARVFYAKPFQSPRDKIWHVEDLHGAKRRRWQEQVNPLLHTQDKFMAHITEDGYNDETQTILQELAALSNTARMK